MTDRAPVDAGNAGGSSDGRVAAALRREPSRWRGPSHAGRLAAWGSPASPRRRFGGLLDRFLAYWLDTILVEIVVVIVANLAGAATGSGTIAALGWMGTYLVLGFGYFVGSWTSEVRATLGMRVLKLQVGNAFDGQRLTLSQAVRRWIGLGVPFLALSVLSGIGTLVGAWSLALFVTTAISPTSQGLHDRFASSAVVQPVDSSKDLRALVVLVLLIVVPIVVFVGYLFLGGQMPSILPDGKGPFPPFVVGNGG